MNKKHVIVITGLDTFNTDLMDTALVEVPGDYIRCTCCGAWEPPESFRKPEETKQSRTNCVSCYMDTWVGMNKKKDIYDTFRKLPRHYIKALALMKERELKQTLESLDTVSELIEKLKRLDSSKKIAIKVGEEFTTFGDFIKEDKLNPVYDETVYVLHEVDDCDEY